MIKYVSHWDASHWLSTVEVMNLQDREATFTAHVYHTDGGEIITHKSTLPAHGDERIDINDQIRQRQLGPENREWQGMIVIEPERQGDEFPAMLTICDAERAHRDWATGNRFVPFMRIEQRPRRRTSRRQAEAREAVPV